MNAKERYLAVFDENERYKLDRVPIHVQYIREEFIEQHKTSLLNSHDGKLFSSDYYDVPFILGFDAVFAPFPLSYKFRPIRILTDQGIRVRVREDGQGFSQKTSYYEGGYVANLQILDELEANVKDVDNSKNILKVFKYYQTLESFIYPVMAVDGIFDRVWKAMGMTAFSRNFRQNSQLYRGLIKFYARLLEININGLIEAIGNGSKIVNILDDVAFRGRTMISPERWEQDFLPYYKKINKIMSDAGLIPQMHSDGDITEIIPSLQKAGFRGLQGWEGGADPIYINDHFPDFVIIGFGDVSHVLPFGTSEEVTKHVNNLMKVLKENRHFVIGPSTVIFKEIPLENVKAFIKAAKIYGNY